MNESDIERMLREQAPEIPVRPGLETRIRVSLRRNARRRPSRAWLALPAAAVIALCIVVLPEIPDPQVIENPPETVPTVDPGTEEEDFVVDTLGNEARAIRKEAERTGRFLLDCMPSLTRAAP